MKKYWANKKIILMILALVLVGVVGLILVHNTQAAEQLSLPLGGSAAGGAAAAGPTAFRGQATLGKISAFGFDVTSTVLAVLGFLTVLQAVLTTLLGIVSFFLDNLFKFNTQLLPNSMSVVYSGWTAMRDIANSIFILILLWIALTIIFNIENLGGKKLLARLLVIALLINFSLTMVSLVFGFANALAKPFQNAINTTDIAGLIIGKTNLHNITSQLNNSERAALEYYGITQEQQEELNRMNETTERGISGGSVDQQKFLPLAVGPEEAKAEGEVAAATAGCGIASLLLPIFPGLSCAGGAIIGAIAKTVGSTLLAIGTIAVSWNMILNLAISNLFLILTIFAFITAGILLLSRIIAMVFVAVLAPAAFLAYTIPGKFGQKYWDMWLDSLFKWSFVAPAFYFLFWMSLLVLDKMSITIPQTGQFSGNVLYMFTLAVFLGFLFASITIAKKMGITVADSFIKWGQKMGWGLAGAAGVGVGAIAKRTATSIVGQPGVQKALTGIAKTPGLRWAGGAYPQRATIKFMEGQRARIKKEADSITSYNKEQTLSDYESSFSPERKIALMQRIVSEGWLRDFEKKHDDDPNVIKNALNLSARYGLQKQLLELRPDLITDANASSYVSGASNRREAIDRIIKTLPDKTKISPEAIRESSDNAEAKKDILRAVLLNAKGPKELERIARENSFLFASLLEYYQSSQNDLKQGFANLNNMSPGKGINQEAMLNLLPNIMARVLGNREQEGRDQGRNRRQRPGQPRQGETEEERLRREEDEDEEARTGMEQ